MMNAPRRTQVCSGFLHPGGVLRVLEPLGGRQDKGINLPLAARLCPDLTSLLEVFQSIRR